MSNPKPETLSTRAIQSLIKDAYAAHGPVRERVRARRQLIVRDLDETLKNLTGTYLPPPFDKSALAIRTMIGETAKAAQHYAARIAANDPKVTVNPMTTRNKLSVTLDKTASEQERLDDQIWEAMGGKACQWSSGMNMSVTGANYYVILPRDADFGLPDRTYYEDASSEELETLRKEGKLTMRKVPHHKTGELVYAEHGDVWAARRRVAYENQAQSGKSLFTLEALPRDMVTVGQDKDGIKWAITFEEVPGSEMQGGNGSRIPEEHALKHGRPAKVWDEDEGCYHYYGIWTDRSGRIVGGIEKGGPPESDWHRPSTFTIIRFFNRIEQVVLVSAGSGPEGATEVYRGKHGCKRGGVPACPVVEVPMMRTGINVTGKEFMTPMDSVYAYTPIINQMLTVWSTAASYNGTPRMYLRLNDGSIMRGEDGEPVEMSDALVPGLNPADFAAFPGEIVQLLINTDSMQEMTKLFFERLDAVAPSAAATGDEGSSGPAWGKRLMIQQQQESLRQPVTNHAEAVKIIFEMVHAWLRDLDMPVRFFMDTDAKSGERSGRALIDFDPANLTDSFQVTQELDTPEERTVRIQEGLELRAQGAITWRDFFDEYLQKQDAREAEIEMYSEQVVQQVFYGTQFPPGSLLDKLARGLQGDLQYMLIEESDNAAIAVAEQMAAQAQAQTAARPTPGAGPGVPDGGMGVADAAGVSMPGMGMNNSLQGQLGPAQPGIMNQNAPVQV